MIDEGHEGVVIPEPALEPEMGAYRLIRDCDSAALITAPAESVGGCHSNRMGEGVLHGGSACRSSITASETVRDKLVSVLLAGAILTETKADACTAAVLWREIDPCISQSALYPSQIVEARDAAPTLKIADGRKPKMSGFGKLLLRPIEEGASGTGQGRGEHRLTIADHIFSSILLHRR